MLLNSSRRCNCLVIFCYIFKFSIWCCLVHVSSLLTYIQYNCNMGGRHRWLLLFRQPITNMYWSEVWCVCLFVINKFFFFFLLNVQWTISVLTSKLKAMRGCSSHHLQATGTYCGGPTIIGGTACYPWERMGNDAEGVAAKHPVSEVRNLSGKTLAPSACM